jgi:flagellar biosynthetic protein FliR
MILSLPDYSLHVQPFLLVFVRISAMLMAIPVFGGQSVPALLKIGFSMAVSMILYPHLGMSPVDTHLKFIIFCIAISGEVLLGIVIGLLIQLVFGGIQLAGQLVGFQMGFAIANVMDPAGADQIPVLSQFNNLMAILVFFTINAHHWMIRAAVESFRLLPPMQFHYSASMIELLMRSAGNMFIIAVQIGAPVIVVLVLTNVSLGILARTVPQMHIFVVAMPVQIMIGLIFLAIAAPYMVSLLGQIFDGATGTMMHIFNVLARGQ